VPAVLALGLIVPVPATIFRPAVELYVPPEGLVPESVGLAEVTDIQKGEPLYEIEAVGNSVSVTVISFETTGLPQVGVDVQTM
jgi:hypothetical protein